MYSFCLVSFTQDHYGEIHLCCCTCLNFIPFHFRVVFHSESLGLLEKAVFNYNLGASGKTFQKHFTFLDFEELPLM